MKHIKVTGCHDCDSVFTNAIYCHGDIVWLCRKDGMTVSEFHKNKTIHPDCPLDDIEEQGNLITAAKIGLYEMRRWRDSDGGCECEPEGCVCGLPRLKNSISIVEKILQPPDA